MKTFFVGLAWFGVLLLPAWATDVAKDDPAEIRAKYSRQSAEALKIAEPLMAFEVIEYKDGGTLGVEITDAKDVQHRFALDFRNLPTKEHPTERGTRNLFVGATYPGRPGSRKVDLGGPEECALYGVMLRWANKHPQRDALHDAKTELDSKDFGNLSQVRHFFLTLDRRFTSR